MDELISRFEKLQILANLPEKLSKIAALEAKSTDPTLWDDQNVAKAVMQELSDLKKEVDEFKEISGTLEILKEVPDEAETREVEKRVKKLELLAYFSGVYDGKNTLVSIHAGQGGTEAMDWANMLYRMYIRYAERRGWPSSTVDYSQGEEAGVKSVTFKVEGKYAYGYLKGETGAHRLVRQSPFNADKLRQTSFANVEVLPELDEVDLPEIEIKEEDLEWQFFRAGSQGGQNVNKVSTAVRVIHHPSGLIVTAQTERFQEQNRKNALSLLRAKLWVRQKEEEKRQKKAIQGDYKPASWGNQIRSYVLHPYKMVKDLRTGVETSNTDAVLDGEIDEFIEGQLKVVES